MNEKAITIAATCIKRSIEDLGLETAEDIVKAAMVAARNDNNSWLLTRDEDRVNAAIVAAFPLLKEEDQERLKREMTFFKALEATSTGVPVDFASLMSETEAAKLLGIRKLWEESSG